MRCTTLANTTFRLSKRKSPMSTMTTPSGRRQRTKQSSPPSSSTIALWQSELTDSVFNSVMGAVSNLAVEMEERLVAKLHDAMRDYSDVDSITALSDENQQLREQCKLLEGRVTRLETETSGLREDLLQLQARSMRDNLIFYNIPEPDNENAQTTLRTFLREEMKISEEDMHQISCDRVHRLGKKTTRIRPLIAKFNPSTGKDLVYRHTRNLNRDKRFGIGEQLPRELEERRKRLLPVFKEAKREQKSAKWSVDKLIVNSQTIEVKKDSITDINVDSVEIATSLRPKHTPPSSQKNTTFQGHSVTVKDTDQIVPAIHALYMNAAVARANHNPYAYRLRCGEKVIEHYEDDREWGAGRALLQVLRENAIVDKLVCVTEWRGHTPLGPARFRHIADTARQTLLHA